MAKALNAMRQIGKGAASEVEILTMISRLDRPTAEWPE
jgi:hypothetical protein